MLLVQNLTFAGNGVVPINGTKGATNKVDAQSVQSSIVDGIAGNSGVPATQADLTAAQAAAVYADSWWYQSGTGSLNGVIDSDGDAGVLTNPAWQLGPLQFVSTSGFLWTPNGAEGVRAGNTIVQALSSATGVNAQTGQFMMYSGTYGVNGSNALTQSTLSGQFTNGVLTVPIAQIVTTGNVSVPGNYSNAGGGMPGDLGSGTYIRLSGNGVSNGPTKDGTYNVMGGNPNVDLAVYYDFASQKLVPEPCAFVLAAFGGLTLLAMRRHE